MSQVLALPQARIPFGFAQVQGQRVPVEITPEWMRALSVLVQRSGGASGDEAFTEYLPQLFDVRTDTTAHEAMQAVDELRNELSAVRGENQRLRAELDEFLLLAIGAPVAVDLLPRLEQLEARIEWVAVAESLRPRIEQLEDRLA